MQDTKNVTEPRKCGVCNGIYERPETYSDSQWSKRKYCSPNCARKTYSSIRNSQWADPEYREMMSKSHKGKPSPLKGTKKPPEKIRKGWKHSAESNEKNRLAHSGKKASLDTRVKMREAKIGAKSYSWKGGVTSANKVVRRSMQYRIWRTAVFERDDYTCQMCRVRGVEIHADHIKPFAFFPELRLEVSNGRTLCVPCHQKTPTYKKQKINENQHA